MNDSLMMHLIKAIADIAIFLEFSSDSVLNPDASMGALEQLSAELQLLDRTDCEVVIHQFRRISKNYEDEQMAQFVESLPETLGLS